MAIGKTQEEKKRLGKKVLGAVHTSSVGAELEINFLEILSVPRFKLSRESGQQKRIDLHNFAEKLCV